MNKRLLGIAALCVLPVSAFAEGNVSTFDNGRASSGKVVYSEDAPVTVVIKRYKKDTPKNVRVNKYYVDTNEGASYGVRENGYFGAEYGGERLAPVPAVKKQEKEVPEDIRDGRFYMGLNGDLSFLSWKNKYSGDDFGSDRFNLKSMLGADVVVGYNFNKNWRVDTEFGYVGKYTEKETESTDSGIVKSEFSLQTYYADLNAYCDIAYGLYAGVGGGLAIVKLSADDTRVSSASTTNLSPMGALMFGWAYALDEKIDFDIRYRFAVFNGGDLNIGGVNIDSGIVMNNSLSVGVKYYF